MYVPKGQSAQQAAAATENAEPEESKEQESPQKPDDQVKLYHDKEWLAILKLAQSQIPLQYDAPNFAIPLVEPEAIYATVAES